jgi:hypothetical protein
MPDYFLPADVTRLLVSYLPLHSYYKYKHVPILAAHTTVDVSLYSSILDAIIRDDVEYCHNLPNKDKKLVFMQRDQDLLVSKKILTVDDVNTITYLKNEIPAYWIIAIKYGRVQILDELTRAAHQHSGVGVGCRKIHYNGRPEPLPAWKINQNLSLAPDIPTLDWIWTQLDWHLYDQAIINMVDNMVLYNQLNLLRWLSGKKMRERGTYLCYVVTLTAYGDRSHIINKIKSSTEMLEIFLLASRHDSKAVRILSA